MNATFFGIHAFPPAPEQIATQPVDETIADLQAAAAEGQEAYFARLGAALTAAGAELGLQWEGPFPQLAFSMNDSAETGCWDAYKPLSQNIMASGYRHALIKRLIALTPDGKGTKPDAHNDDVAWATLKAMQEFIKTEGRILVSPEGELSEGAGLPKSWGTTADRDDEIVSAGRVYFSATACPFPRSIVLDFAKQFGRPTENGWKVLDTEAPFFAKPAVAFAAWKLSGERIIASGEDADDAFDWAIQGLAERVIVESDAHCLASIEARLWLALDIELTEREESHAVYRGDLSFLMRRRAELDFVAGTLVSAIAALRTAANV